VASALRSSVGRGQSSSLCRNRRTIRDAEKSWRIHPAFAVETRQQVEAFYRAALEAGGKDNGAPDLRRGLDSVH
jgi:predicted lactoylglutathione lyase